MRANAATPTSPPPRTSPVTCSPSFKGFWRRFTRRERGRCRRCFPRPPRSMGKAGPHVDSGCAPALHRGCRRQLHGRRACIGWRSVTCSSRRAASPHYLLPFKACNRISVRCCHRLSPLCFSLHVCACSPRISRLAPHQFCRRHHGAAQRKHSSAVLLHGGACGVCNFLPYTACFIVNRTARRTVLPCMLNALFSCQ